MFECTTRALSQTPTPVVSEDDFLMSEAASAGIEKRLTSLLHAHSSHAVTFPPHEHTIDLPATSRIIVSEVTLRVCASRRSTCTLMHVLVSAHEKENVPTCARNNSLSPKILSKPSNKNDWKCPTNPVVNANDAFRLACHLHHTHSLVVHAALQVSALTRHERACAEQIAGPSSSWIACPLKPLCWMRVSRVISAQPVKSGARTLREEKKK